MNLAVLTGALSIEAAAAQKYAGPMPPKPDVVYLVHADSLIPAEALEARQEKRKDDIVYVVAGAASPVKTPMASPIFLLQADKIAPERLELYRLESKGSQREVLFSRKNKQAARQIRLNVTRLAPDLYKIEVDESLENGEYSLTPADSNQVFCFQVY